MDHLTSIAGTLKDGSVITKHNLYSVHSPNFTFYKVRVLFFSPIDQLRRLLTQRFLTFRCVLCVKIKDTDEVLPVKEGRNSRGGNYSLEFCLLQCDVAFIFVALFFLVEKI